MKQKYKNATANINISDIYWFEHHCYWAFNITFENSDTEGFFNLIAICANNGSKEKAQEYLDGLKEAFKSVGITEGEKINIIFDLSTGEIATMYSDLSSGLVDVRNNLKIVDLSTIFVEVRHFILSQIA